MLAPILISVYTRKFHLEKSIEALKKNLLAKESTVYIVSDAPFSDKDINKVKEVRAYIDQIKGFKEVKKIYREKNYGSHKSCEDAITQILKKYKKIIFLEDDIVTSKYFLKFMNESLEKFKKRTEVFSICAYVPPNYKLPSNYINDIYMWGYYCPWGMATWEDRWNELDLEVKNYKKFFKSKLEVVKFFNGANHVLPILIEDRLEKIKAMDARIDWNIFIKKQCCIYPRKSLTRNIGVDGSGEHSPNLKLYQEQTLEDFDPEIIDSIYKDESIRKSREKYHKFPLIKRLGVYSKIFGFYPILEKLKVVDSVKKIRRIILYEKNN